MATDSTSSLEESMRSVGKKRTPSEVISDRRKKERETFNEVISHVPISKGQLETATQMSAFRIVTQFIKVRKLLEKAAINSRSDIVHKIIREAVDFKGFVMIVDLSGVILCVTENVSEQLGLCLTDVIGQPFIDLLHPDDGRDFKKNFTSISRDVRSKSHMSVFRMRKSMSNKLVSKIDYKNVLVISRLKSFGGLSKACSSSDKDHTDSVAAVLLCRTEDCVGIPEIVMGGYLDCHVNDREHSFSYVDPKVRWLLGFSEEDLIGKRPCILDHPGDVENCQPVEHLCPHKHPHCHNDGTNNYDNGYIRFPKCRILSSWGQWIWAVSEFWTSGQDKVADVHLRIILLEPDDSEMANMKCSHCQEKFSPDDVDCLMGDIIHHVCDETTSTEKCSYCSTSVGGTNSEEIVNCFGCSPQLHQPSNCCHGNHSELPQNCLYDLPCCNTDTSPGGTVQNITDDNYFEQSVEDLLSRF